MVNLTADVIRPVYNASTKVPLPAGSVRERASGPVGPWVCGGGVCVWWCVCGGGGVRVVVVWVWVWVEGGSHGSTGRAGSTGRGGNRASE